MGHFLAVRSKVGIVAELASRLARPAASGYGAGGAELVGEVVEDSA